MKLWHFLRYLYRVYKSDLKKLSPYQAPKKPRVAFCLFGLVGSVKGKSGENQLSSEEVLRLAHQHYKKHIFNFNDQIDVFIHTWSTELEKPIKELYQPKKAVFQNQITFSLPDYLVGKPQRRQNQYSMSYSMKQVLGLKSAYEKENGFQYDLVMLIRFDIAWQKDLLFDRFDPQFFYAANLYNEKPLYGFIPLRVPLGYPYTELPFLADLWFFSNSTNMDRFSDLFDHLDEYNKPENCPLSIFGISNHVLVCYHLGKIGLLKDLRFVFNHFGKDAVDPLVRKVYFGSKE